MIPELASYFTKNYYAMLDHFCIVHGIVNVLGERGLDERKT
jgi:hypothetical protein